MTLNTQRKPVCTYQSQSDHEIITTVEPRFNKPLYNEVVSIMDDILQPVQSYSKMYGTELRYNKFQYNEILLMRNAIQKPKCKIYPNITNKCHHTRVTKDECGGD